MNAADLEERLRAVLLRHEDVCYAYLYGSRALGRSRSDSDVDVAIAICPPERAPRVWLDVMGELAVAAAPLEVDCLLLNDAPLGLRFAIVRDGRPLVDRDRARRLAFEVGARREYWDWEPYRALHDQALLRRLREGTYGTRDARSLAQG